MAAGDTNIGTGSSLAFAGVTSDLTSLTWDGIERVSVQTSHMGTSNAHTFLPGDLYDPGELTAELNLDVTEDVTTPLTAASSTLTVTLPNDPSSTSTTTWVGTAFLRTFSFNDPLEDVITATATFKFSGAITIT